MRQATTNDSSERVIDKWSTESEEAGDQGGVRPLMKPFAARVVVVVLSTSASVTSWRV